MGTNLYPTRAAVSMVRHMTCGAILRACSWVYERTRLASEIESSSLTPYGAPGLPA